VHNLLGVAYHQHGDTQEAVASVRKALALKPDLPGAHYNLGAMLQALQRHDEAIEHYRKALALDPKDAQAHSNLGSALNALGRHNEAVEHFERATALKPDFAEAQVNFGNCLRALGRNDEAASCYQRALALRPQLADVHFLLGNAQLALGRHEQAIASYQRALALRADWPEVHYNLGNVFEVLKGHEEAIQHYRQALALRPTYVEAHVNLGNPLQLLNRYDEAIEHYRQALALDPNLAVARMNLAGALQALNRPGEALRELDQAISLWPSYAEAKNNKSLLLLGLGRFAEAWDLYDSRWDVGGEDKRPRPYTQRRWRGEKVDGPLLIWGEQGLGDQILYASLLPEAVERATSIVVEVEPRLVPLMARSFPRLQVVAAGGDLYRGPVAAQTSMVGLAQEFRRSWDSFRRSDQGFLTADPVRAAELRQRLVQDRPVTIGISWRSTHPIFGQSKSARLADFEPVSRLPGCRLVDLQYGETRAEREGMAGRSGMAITKLDDIDNTNDIDGLAALIAACDVVVTVSNTTAHLAGALGKPTWVMVPHGHARLWYWFKERPESPWYPRVNLRFQGHRESWESLASRTCADLEVFLGAIVPR
jgi:tetratricopeptide (TPR) repeat protein